MKIILELLFYSNVVSLLVSVNCFSTIFFFKSETTILESVANPDKNTQTPKQERKNTGRIIIIVAGSALSLALILKIIYELYTYFHISNQIVVPHVVNDVYEDIVAGNDQRVLRCL